MSITTKSGMYKAMKKLKKNKDIDIDFFYPKIYDLNNKIEIELFIQ